MVTQTTIVIVFLLLGLGNIGVDTTPLLAGAGIAGLAIGFGAQKLVTDVVSGIFFLVDDAFRTGEYVEVEGTMGTVEKISIRSMQLRHHKGPVHTIPYGEIPKITNFSRDWVIMKLRFTVPFDTDPNKVKKIFKKIGQDMLVMDEFKDTSSSHSNPKACLKSTMWAWCSVASSWPSRAHSSRCARKSLTA
jgi:small-conductance mechanosensitive channel